MKTCTGVGQLGIVERCQFSKAQETMHVRDIFAEPFRPTIQAPCLKMRALHFEAHHAGLHLRKHFPKQSQINSILAFGELHCVGQYRSNVLRGRFLPSGLSNLLFKGLVVKLFDLACFQPRAVRIQLHAHDFHQEIQAENIHHSHCENSGV